MNTTVKAGILIGVLCAIWTFVMGFTGWFKDPVMMNAFYVVIAIQIVILYWGLKKSAAEKEYWGQVGTGTLMSVVAGVILIVSSLIFTLVVFPNYFAELRTAYEGILRGQGKTDAELATLMDAWSQTQTPALQAIFGFIGTVVTGFVGSLIIAVTQRKKSSVQS